MKKISKLLPRRGRWSMKSIFVIILFASSFFMLKPNTIAMPIIDCCDICSCLGIHNAQQGTLLQIIKAMGNELIALGKKPAEIETLVNDVLRTEESSGKRPSEGDNLEE